MNDDLLLELIQEVRTLREHIQVLWQVLQELRDELKWANNNAGQLLPRPDAGQDPHRIF